MALIVGKRRMMTNPEAAPSYPPICPQSIKKWCSSASNQDKQTITIPQTSIEKLKVVFPTVEDKVYTFWREFHRCLKKL